MRARLKLSFVFCLLALASEIQAGSIYDLGLLPGGTFSATWGFGTSDMGLSGVGYANSSAYTLQPFYWQASTGIHGIPLPAGYTSGALYAMSANGLAAAGYIYGPPGFDQAVRWTPAGGLIGLGYLPGGGISDALGISSDGSVVAGYGIDSSNHEQAFRWTQAGGMVGLGKVAGFADSLAYNVSRNGAIVVGEVSNPTNGIAFKWTQSSGLATLGRLPGDSYSQAFAVSDDGSVVVGLSTGLGQQAFRWTPATGMMGLGFLPGSSSSEARGVSGDGSLIVGNSGVGFIWDAAHGMRDLRSFLQTDGVNVAPWDYLLVEDISADGTILSGRGGFNGTSHAWIAVIPEPQMFSVLLLGFSALLIRRSGQKHFCRREQRERRAKKERGRKFDAAEE